MGRFVTTDPLGYVDGPSLYAFAGNNPSNFGDPLGLSCIECRYNFQGKPDFPHFSEGIVMQQYQAAASGALDDSNSGPERFVSGFLALSAAPLAGLEEIGRGILNTPFDLNQAREEGIRGELRYFALSEQGLSGLELMAAMEAEGFSAVTGPGIAMTPLGPGRLLKGGIRSFPRGAIGFADDAVTSAYQGMRSGGGHAMRHLIDEGLIQNSGSLASRAQIFQDLTSPILRSPAHTFDWRVGNTLARGFGGRVGGRDVVVFVAKEGPYQGRVLSAVVPDANQIAQWGLR